MGALATAGSTWAARGDPGSASAWCLHHALGAARPMGAFSTGVRVDWGPSQRPVHVDCGLSYTTGQATIAQSTIVAGINNNNNNVSVL